MLKNWCFRTVVLEKTLENSLESKEIRSVNSKGNQPWIFIGNTDAEASILCPLMWRADSLEKTLMLGKIESRRRGEQQRTRWLDASPTQLTWVCTNSERQWRTEKPGMLQSMGSQRAGHDWATEQQWTEHLQKVQWRNDYMNRDSPCPQGVTYTIKLSAP